MSEATEMRIQKSAVKEEPEEVQGGPSVGPMVQDTEGTMCLSIAQKYANASSELQEALSEMEESYNAAVRITGREPPNMPNMELQQTFYTASGAHFCQIGATPKAQAKSRAAASGAPDQAVSTENQESGVTLEEITELIHEGKMEEANVIAEQVSKLIQEGMEKVHTEQVSKLIQEGMEKVHKSLYNQLKEGSEKFTYQVQREVASVKQEFNNLHMNVQNNCVQVRELGEKLQRTQEEAAAATAKSEERIDKKFDDKFDELKSWLMQNMGNQISTEASSASAAGHHTREILRKAIASKGIEVDVGKAVAGDQGGAAMSAEQAAQQEEQPRAKAAKTEGSGDKSL